jgi:hypothetical protein
MCHLVGLSAQRSGIGLVVPPLQLAPGVAPETREAVNGEFRYECKKRPMNGRLSWRAMNGRNPDEWRKPLLLLVSGVEVEQLGDQAHGADGVRASAVGHTHVQHFLHRANHFCDLFSSIHTAQFTR